MNWFLYLINPHPMPRHCSDIDSMVMDFLNTKYPESLRCFPSQSKHGMPALLCDIYDYDGRAVICRYSYFFETKKSYITPSQSLEQCLRGFFNVGMVDMERIIGLWVSNKLPALRTAIMR